MGYVCVVILLLMSSCVFAAGGFTFVQLADPQLGFASPDMSVEIANFTQTIQEINQLKPAFVVINGDMLNAAHDPTQTREFWRIARKIDRSIPIYLVPGNHDMNVVNQTTLKTYTKFFGADYYSFTYQNSEFIVLDTMRFCGGQCDPKLRDEQLEWFKSALNAARERNVDHIFVLTHHPWFLAKPDEKDEYFNVHLDERPKYLALMREYGVDFALAGHVHDEVIAKDGKMAMITTSAVSKSLGKSPVGYRVFTVNGKSVKNEYIPLKNGKK